MTLKRAIPTVLLLAICCSVSFAQLRDSRIQNTYTRIAESRQFDFWIGEWKVVNMFRQDFDNWSEEGEGYLKVWPVLDGKAVMELCDGMGRGNKIVKGFSIRYYDKTRNKWIACLNWTQENNGGFFLLDGGFKFNRAEIFNEMSKPDGKILLQMGGKGNAVKILSVLDKIISQPEWSQYFSGFEFPYGFYGDDEYKALLAETGFENIRAELIPKDMIHSGKAGLEGWIRTTWLPYIQRIPENERERFIDELSSRYVEENPVDPEGNVHVAMVRIEIEAVRPV